MEDDQDIQQIFVKGQAGLTHMLASTNYALNLSEDLKIKCEVFHDWVGWQMFYDVFDVQHKNFKPKIPAPPILIDVREINIEQLYKPTLPIKITSASTDFLKRPDEFFKVYKLTSPCFEILKQKYELLDNGEYAAIHIRGGEKIVSKYNNDYEFFLSNQTKRIESILELIPKTMKILIVSDNSELLSKYVDNKKIFTTSIILEMYNKGIQFPKTKLLYNNHKCYTNGVVTEFDVEFNSVLDLYLLAHSKLIFADTKYSGFAQTGVYLHKIISNNSKQRLL